MDTPFPLCPHFGRCGGCHSQDTPYSRQLAAKTDALQTLFAPFWMRPIDITPSPVLWNYRNKIDPAFSPKHYDTPPPKDFIRDTVFGFKQKGRWFDPLEIEECRIGPEGTEPLLAAMHAWRRESGLRGFNSRNGDGFLRTLLIRDAKRTGERMVVLITRPGPFDPTPFVEAVRSSFNADSIHRGVFSGLADTAMADELELLHGNPAIMERMHVPEAAGREVWPSPAKALAAEQRAKKEAPAHRALSFRISPMSFFQTNPLAAERLYGLIRQWVRRTGAENLFDFYGGMGGIAFSCADLVKNIWSVEEVAAASEDGRHNAAENGIENVTFITSRVKNFLKQQMESGGMPPRSAVVLDPPRGGMTPKAARRCIDSAPPHVLYVSCNPKVLAQELPLFMDKYTLTGMQAVDMFPHTPHVEVLAEMELRRED